MASFSSGFSSGFDIGGAIVVTVDPVSGDWQIFTPTVITGAPALPGAISTIPIPRRREPRKAERQVVSVAAVTASWEIFTPAASVGIIQVAEEIAAKAWRDDQERVRDEAEVLAHALGVSFEVALELV